MKIYKMLGLSVKRSFILISSLMVLSLGAAPIINVGLTSADSISSYVSLSSFSGYPDADLTVSGGNYTRNETIKISATQSGQQVASASTSANANGQFSSGLQLPAKLSQGNVIITAVGETSGLTSTNSYYVNPFSPSLSVNNSQTTPFSTVVVSGTGYAPGEKVDLDLAGSVSTTQADASGDITDVDVTTPDVKAASYELTGVGEVSGATAISYEYINGFYPSASPSSYYVMPGASLGFSGSGFAPNETVNITDSTTGKQISSFQTDAEGNFQDAGSFSVPASYAGLTKTFELIGTKSNASTTTSATIGVYYPSVSPSAYYLEPGSTLGFTGSGFIAGETVDIYSGNSIIASTKANSYGNVSDSAAVTIPVDAAGTNQTFTLVGEQSLGKSSVTVQIGSFNPQASPSSYYVMPGSNIAFSGSGYAPGESINVYSGLTDVATFSADSTGSFSAEGSSLVPYSQANSSLSYTLVGTVSDQPINFKIGVGQLNTQITPSSYYVLPYSSFGVSVSGFAPNETVSLSDATGTLATATADAYGNATFSDISLPYTSSSSVLITATGSTSAATATVSIGIGSYNSSITSSNYYVTPGSQITLSGSGFAPGELVTIQAGSASQVVNADAKGNISAPLIVPFGQKLNNSLTITATGSLSHSTSNTAITLAPYTPQVSPSTYYAQPGTAVSFTGSGFYPGESVAVSLNGNNVGTEIANSKGALNSKGTYLLPFGKTNATYVLTGQTSGGSSTVTIGLAQFYAGLSLSSYYGDGGSAVVANGSGFAPGESVAITTGSNKLGSATADSYGNFSKTIIIPYSAPSQITISAVGDLSQATTSTSYTVAQVYNSVSLGNYAVPAGNSLSILGSGFFGGEPVTVTTDRSTGTYTFDAEPNGNLDDNGFIVPSNLAPGMLTLTITGSESYTVHTITIYVQNPQEN